MIFLGVFLGIAIMGSMIYMVMDKKSTPVIRTASLIAIGIMVLTSIICLFLIFTDNKVVIDESILIVGAPVEIPDESSSNIWIFLLLAVILLALFAIIAIHTITENRKNKQKSSDKMNNYSSSYDF